MSFVFFLSHDNLLSKRPVIWGLKKYLMKDETKTWHDTYFGCRLCCIFEEIFVHSFMLIFFLTSTSFHSFFFFFPFKIFSDIGFVCVSFFICILLNSPDSSVFPLKKIVNLKSLHLSSDFLQINLYSFVATRSHPARIRSKPKHTIKCC